MTSVIAYAIAGWQNTCTQNELALAFATKAFSETAELSTKTREELDLWATIKRSSGFGRFLA
jgi:hypothetical protein